MEFLNVNPWIAPDGDFSRCGALPATGFTKDNLMLDCGVRIGLNRHAEDFGLFTGFTVRF